MNRSFLFFPLAAALFASGALCACSDDPEVQNPPLTPSLELEPAGVETLEFSADGATATSDGETLVPTFRVVTNQAEWQAVSDQTWLTVTRDDTAGAFTLSAAANTAEESPAPAKVTVTAGEANPVTLTVTQKPFVPEPTPEDPVYGPGKVAGTYYLLDTPDISAQSHYVLQLNADGTGELRSGAGVTELSFAWSNEAAAFTFTPADGSEPFTGTLTPEDPAVEGLMTLALAGDTPTCYARLSDEQLFDETWGTASAYDTGEHPAVAIADNGLLLAAHQTGLGAQSRLMVRAGRQDFTGQVTWLESAADLGEGELPRVAVNTFGYAVLVYRSAAGSWLCRTGLWQPATSVMMWGEAANLGLSSGEEPLGVALTPGTYASINRTDHIHKALLITRTSTGNIACRRGTTDGVSIAWEGSTDGGWSLEGGGDASLAMNDNGLIALAYRTDAGAIDCRFGQYTFTDDALTWYPDALHLADGRTPSVALSDHNRVAVSYLSPRLPELHYATGTVDLSTGAPRFIAEDEGLYGYGSVPSIAFTDKGSVVALARNAADNGLSLRGCYLFQDIDAWMGRLSSSTPLAGLTIPGTHDAGARSGLISACQDMSIMEQLAAGVRYIDLRLNMDNGRLRVYHGIMPQDLYFEEVKTAVESFVTAFPTECVLLFVRHELDEPEKEQKLEFEAAFRAEAGKNDRLWYVKSKMPNTVAGAQGKVVLLRKFAIPSGVTADLGVNMSAGAGDNGTYTNNSGFKIQDHYDLTADEIATVKWPEFTALLEEARSNEIPYQFYMNNCNISGGLREPYANAWIDGSPAMNPRLEEYIEQNKGQKQRLGIINMDFPTPQMIRDLVAFNF